MFRAFYWGSPAEGVLFALEKGVLTYWSATAARWFGVLGNESFGPFYSLWAAKNYVQGQWSLGGGMVDCRFVDEPAEEEKA
jgi:hypothetical protein